MSGSSLSDGTEVAEDAAQGSPAPTLPVRLGLREGSDGSASMQGLFPASSESSEPAAFSDDMDLASSESSEPTAASMPDLVSGSEPDHNGDLGDGLMSLGAYHAMRHSLFHQDDVPLAWLGAGGRRRVVYR